MDKKPNISLTHISSPVLRTIREYIKLIKAHGIRVEKVILFGSYAKGKNYAESDIDLCLISPLFGENYHETISKLNFLSYGFDLPMDIVPFTPSNLEEKYSALAREIRTNGLTIHI